MKKIIILFLLLVFSINVFANDNNENACLDKKIEAFKNENGQDASINREILDEWDAQCNSSSEGNIDTSSVKADDYDSGATKADDSQSVATKPESGGFDIWTVLTVIIIGLIAFVVVKAILKNDVLGIKKLTKLQQFILAVFVLGIIGYEYNSSNPSTENQSKASAENQSKKITRTKYTSNDSAQVAFCYAFLEVAKKPNLEKTHKLYVQDNAAVFFEEVQPALDKIIQCAESNLQDKAKVEACKAQFPKEADIYNKFIIGSHIALNGSKAEKAVSSGGCMGVDAATR